ncbi:MAG: xanthine dehydrogenase family protein molybdopterin-binding subunit [Chloroflexi bacterium]|nr:xanthine dehydrogenase family protein molybdopterin-binding subunit [Chloroflexota bacterium]
MSTFQVIGKSGPGIYGAQKSRGEAKFAGDLSFLNMLTGKILRSPHAHARLVNMDTRRAVKLPGVKAVVTGADAPPVRIGRWIRDRHILARNKVRHIGEAVAAVAAVDDDTALEAISLIQVDYEPLPAVFDPVEAMDLDSPLVHEELDSYAVSMPPAHRSRGNVCQQVHLRMGDVEKAWPAADLIVEDTFSTPKIHHGFIQPHEAVAAVDSSGKVTLWASCKGPFQMRHMTAMALEMPVSRLRVISAKVGGDFGGKGTPSMEPVCVLLAMKSGLPVKLALGWDEEFSSTFTRTRSFSKLKTGVKKDGTLVVFQGEVILDTGAYNDGLTGPSRVYNVLQGPYFIPNVEIKGWAVYSNNPPSGNVRAPRTPQQCFAIESHLDNIARKLGIDPLELRLKNAVKDGDPLPAGGYFSNPGLKKTIEACMDYVAKERKGKEENVGWGVACAERALHPTDEQGEPSSLWIKLDSDGSAVIYTGCAEQGGGQHDILVQIVAETLRLSPGRISVVASDTEATPYEMATGASQTAYRTGNSAIMAAEDARRQILSLASDKLGVPVDGLALEDGRVFQQENPARAVSFAELALAALFSRQGAIMGTGADQRAQWLAGNKAHKGAMEGTQLGTHVVKLAVDRETGKVTLLDYFASHDAGFALNPSNVEGQIQGGASWGMGYGLMEQMIIEKGRVLNNRFRDHKVPRPTDVPNVQTQIVEVPSRPGPFGAKGVGEPPAVPGAAAIANAIFDAVGVRVNDLPITSEKLWKAMHEQV